MNDIGILYTEVNRLAVIEDRKAMTRRLPASFKVINEKPDEWEFSGFTEDGILACFEKKYGFALCKLPYAAGDMLYIKEPHYKFGFWEPIQLPGALKPYKWRFHYDECEGVYFPDNIPPRILGCVCTSREQIGWFKRSPLFMFKEDARHWQRVKAVKVERLQSISEEDAKAEGVSPCTWHHLPDGDGEDISGLPGFPDDHCPYRNGFANVWDSINGPGAWERNPWLVAVALERVTGNKGCSR